LEYIGSLLKKIENVPLSWRKGKNHSEKLLVVEKSAENDVDARVLQPREENL
jgi:hypothetical protein